MKNLNMKSEQYSVKWKKNANLGKTYTPKEMKGIDKIHKHDGEKGKKKFKFI